MLFKVEHGKSPFELNPELKAIEKFKDLTDRQMTYVILTSDYKTPFRKQEPEQQRYLAAIESGYKLEKDGKRLDMNGRNVVAGKDGRVEAARTYYRNELDKDDDYASLLSLNALMAQIRNLNNKPDKNYQELAAAVNLNVDKLDKLMATKKKLEEILDMRDEAPAPVVLEDEGTIDASQLSLLAQVNEGII